MDKSIIDALLRKIESTETSAGNPRVQALVNRIVRDLFVTIDEFDVQPDEFWSAVSYLTQAGQSGEWGLIAAGLGFEHFLDLRMDDAEARRGVSGGTPRTIEGPLYVAGAPLSQGFARLDQDPQPGEVLFMQGQVRGADGMPLAGAQVEVWHANHLGGYSFFDPSQTPFNLRRTIVADAQGRYRLRSKLPVGYSVPPDGATDKLLKAMGRHGSRPAHIHFFVTAPGHRKLTTQINIEGDPYLWDDFAFGTREGLVPPLARVTDPAILRAREVDAPFYAIDFDFDLLAHGEGLPADQIERAHFQA